MKAETLDGFDGTVRLTLSAKEAQQLLQLVLWGVQWPEYPIGGAVYTEFNRLGVESRPPYAKGPHSL